MSKEVLIPKKWVWDGVCTYSTKYEFLSNYFIKQPATAGTAGQVLALNSDLEPVWQDEGELPAPGTEGQVLALNASLEPVWQDDKTTTVFQQSDVPSTLNHKGDTYIVDSGSGFALTLGSVHYLNYFSTGNVNRFSVVSSLSTAAQMKGMIGIAYSTDASDGILLRGLIHLNYDVGGTNGDQVYIAGSGQLSTTSPSGSGEYVRAVGYRIDNVSGNSIVFFDPSKDNIELN